MAEVGLRGWLLWALLLQGVSLLPMPHSPLPSLGVAGGCLVAAREGPGLAAGLWTDGGSQRAQEEGVGEGSGLPKCPGCGVRWTQGWGGGRWARCDGAPPIPVHCRCPGLRRLAGACADSHCGSARGAGGGPGPPLGFLAQVHIWEGRRGRGDPAQRPGLQRGTMAAAARGGGPSRPGPGARVAAARPPAGPGPRFSAGPPSILQRSPHSPPHPLPDLANARFSLALQ